MAWGRGFQASHAGIGSEFQELAAAEALLKNIFHFLLNQI
jgi:hypothetical protein